MILGGAIEAEEPWRWRQVQGLLKESWIKGSSGRRPISHGRTMWATYRTIGRSKALTPEGIFKNQDLFPTFKIVNRQVYLSVV